MKSAVIIVDNWTCQFQFFFNLLVTLMREEATITNIVTGGHFVEGDDDKTLLAHEEVGLKRPCTGTLACAEEWHQWSKAKPSGGSEDVRRLWGVSS